MDAFPERADLADAPDTFESGHLWLFEYVTGLPLRFHLRSDGQLRFGDDRRVFRPGDVPTAYQPAVTAVRTDFDRDRLRSAADDVSEVTLYGIATCYRGVDYDWARLPTVVVTDIRSGADLLGPDALVRSCERLGLSAAPVVEKERRADAFDPGSVTFPASAYADEPAAGLDVADKRGTRGRVHNAAVADPTDRGFESVDDAVRALLPDDTGGAGVEQARNRIVRESYGTLLASGIDPDDADLDSAVAKALERA
jgi:hypothetical protein